MNKRTTIITLGILVALMPFLGFPGTAKTIFFVLAGIAIALIAYVGEIGCDTCRAEEKESSAVSVPQEETRGSDINERRR